MTRPTAVTGLLFAALLAACGNDGSPAGPDSEGRASSTSLRASAGPRSSLEVEVILTGRYERGAVHVVRVERPDGQRVFERTLGSDRRLTEALAPGDYRMLSFQRECKTTCGAKPKPEALGGPTDICGSYFAVKPAAITRAVVKLAAGEGCQVTIA